jgi:hypothetical protein
MKVLLVRPPISLQVAQRLTPFLHLEPLALEIVAGGIPAGHATRTCDLATEAAPDKKFRSVLGKFRLDVIGFTVFSPPPGTDLWKKYRADFICPDPHAFYDCMHTLLPTRVPLKMFYRYLSLLWLFSSWHNPWRMNKVKVPLRSLARFMYHGMRYGWSVRNIYLDYQGQQFSKRSDL